MSETVQTYKGYDANGNVIVTKTAKNANETIDVSAIEKAVENVKTVIQDELSTIASALRYIDATDNDITSGTNMSQAINEYCTELESAGQQAKFEKIAQLDDILTQAKKKCDADQKTLNSNARQECINTQGVVRVEP